MRSIKLLLILMLGAAAVADVVLHARVMLYSGDETFNLDTIVTFLRSGDYTTAHFGGYPFDPVVSSGVLATWPYGSVFVLGGSLFAARVVSGLLQLAAAVAVGTLFGRSQRMSRLDSVLIALSVWGLALFVGNHELRVINPGEMWGVLYLLAGTLMVGRAPYAAATVWGLAVWLCKIIYLPFAAVLIVATAWTLGREPGRKPAPVLARLVAAFLVPLLAWMLLIWTRHDAGAVVSWTAAYLVFVVRHATGIALDTSSLPVFEGWRFEPGWSPTSFLGYRYWVTLPALLPLAAGPAAAFLWVLTRRKRTHRADVERGYVLAVAALVVLFGLWFLAVDPTQWGRHLLPAVYASLALATYCVVSAWRSRASGSAAAGTVALVACVAIAALVLGRTRAYAQHEGWHLSHSKTCRGPTVVAPPCWQDKALTMVSSLTVELCDIHGRAFDEDCMKENRRAFLARAGALADQYSGDPEIVATAGYVVLFVEQWAYADEREFFEDLSSLLCEGQRSAIAAYFEAAGAPVDGLLARCDERS